MATKRAMALVTWVECDEEGDGFGGKSDGNEGSGGATAIREMVTVRATTWAMGKGRGWWVTKRAMTMVARAMLMAIRVAGNKEGNGDSGKSHGDSNKAGRQATATKDNGDGNGNDMYNCNCNEDGG
jgi:hypothetical protein